MSQSVNDAKRIIETNGKSLVHKRPVAVAGSSGSFGGPRSGSETTLPNVIVETFPVKASSSMESEVVEKGYDLDGHALPEVDIEECDVLIVEGTRYHVVQKHPARFEGETLYWQLALKQERVR